MSNERLLSTALAQSLSLECYRLGNVKTLIEIAYLSPGKLGEVLNRTEIFGNKISEFWSSLATY